MPSLVIAEKETGLRLKTMLTRAKGIEGGKRENEPKKKKGILLVN